MRDRNWGIMWCGGEYMGFERKYGYGIGIVTGVVIV